MTKSITIAVDAMGGENSPKKIIDAIELYHRENKNIIYKIFGNQNIIEKIILNKSINKENYELIHTEEKIEKVKFRLILGKFRHKCPNLGRTRIFPKNRAPLRFCPYGPLTS